MPLDQYFSLGRTGLRVSRLALGTMTFGTEWGWGADRDGARALFDRYLEVGGNFLDTANGYTGGTSETPRRTDGSARASSSPSTAHTVWKAT